MQQPYLIAVATLIIGLVVGVLLGPTFTPDDPTPAPMHEQMAAMNAGLIGKTGDEFDRAFITEMIAHHQGAIAMAQLALANANHAEIKQMADAIISAQSTEISQMTAWYSAWFGNAPHHAQ